MNSPGARLSACEQGTLRIRLVQVFGNGPAVVDNGSAIDQNGNAALAGERDRLLLEEAPRHRLDIKPFVGKSQAHPPAIGAEAALILGCCQIIKPDRHDRSPR
jgi:hypothetical protein